MVNSHCGFTSHNASEITNAIEDAYCKMTEEERDVIDELAEALKDELEALYLQRTGRKNNGIGEKASRELLGKLGIWMEENNVERRFVVVERC